MTILPKKFSTELICNVDAMDRQVNGIHLIVVIDFSKSNRYSLPIPNVVAKSWIFPNATQVLSTRTAAPNSPQKKTPFLNISKADPLSSVVREERPVRDFQEVLMLSIDDV